MANAIVIPFLSTFNNGGLRDAENSLAKLGASVKKFGKQLTAGYTGMQAINKSIAFVSSSVNASRDLERNLAGLQTIFGSLTPQMAEFAKTGSQYGMSNAAAAKATTFLGSVLKQAGFNMNDVAGKTKQLTALAADLAATYGYDVQEALTGMTALFRGEYDPIEKFGVAMKQSQVNAMLAADGQKNLTGAALLHAQQQARLKLLLEKTTDAQGAFQRQGGSLFVQQQKLNAAFTDMQASIGKQLTPALAKLVEQMIPLVEKMGPHLGETFAAFGDIVTALLPHIDGISGAFNSLLDALATIVNDLAPVLEEFFGFIKTNGLFIVTFFATFKTAKFFIGLATAAIKEFKIAVKLATAAEAEFVAVEMATPWGLIAAGIGLAVAGVVALANAWQDAQGKKFAYDKNAGTMGSASSSLDPLYTYKLRNAKDPSAGRYSALDAASRAAADAGTAGRYAAMEAFAKKQSAKAKEDAKNNLGPGSSTQTIKNAVKSFYDSLTENIKQESAKLKLKKLGASDAFIQSVVGSGSDWEKVFASVTAKGKTGLMALQAQFNKTTEGKKELEDIAQKAKDAQDAIDAFKKSINDAIYKPLANTEVSIGRFEQQVLDSFSNISDAFQSAFDKGTIQQDALNSLQSFANKQQAIFIDMAKKRDALAAKISDAQALYDNVKSAVVGFGNITGLLTKDTETITESSTRIIEGISVTFTKTTEQLKKTDLVAAYKEILDKTKAFATNLKILKDSGLNQDLFKQIVDAGVEAGGATAAAIVEGGSGTITELNTLFGQLQETGNTIAEQTTVVMYNNGVDVMGGYIAGLLSQQDQLLAAAQTMADEFAAALKSAMDAALAAAKQSSVMSISASQVDTFDLAHIIAGGASSPLTSEDIHFANALQNSGATVNVTVNAGLGTNGSTVAKDIITTIKSYERTNGAVWISA